ncbi:S-layer homology domain-containing protein [Paenibacillus marchantiophytorum]|nr:S-layer homology domain-containing protein [Paenibacillus marchantiophytorum]
MGGYEDGSFKPDKTISREEMAIILSRVINLNAVTKDASEFDPKADSSRAEALQVILNALNLNPDIKTLFDFLN